MLKLELRQSMQLETQGPTEDFVVRWEVITR